MLNVSQTGCSGTLGCWKERLGAADYHIFIDIKPNRPPQGAVKYCNKPIKVPWNIRSWKTAFGHKVLLFAYHSVHVGPE